MKNTIKPTRGQFNILRQICNLIPKHEVSKIARETGVEDQARTFSPWELVTPSACWTRSTDSLHRPATICAIPCNCGRGRSRPFAEPPRPAATASLTPQPEAVARDGRETFLADPGSFDSTDAGLCGGKTAGAGLPLQDAHPCDRQHDDGTGGQLPRLGQAPTAQGGGQDPHALEPAESAAQFRHRAPPCRPRPQAGARTEGGI